MSLCIIYETDTRDNMYNDHNIYSCAFLQCQYHAGWNVGDLVDKCVNPNESELKSKRTWACQRQTCRNSNHMAIYYLLQSPCRKWIQSSYGEVIGWVWANLFMRWVLHKVRSKCRRRPEIIEVAVFWNSVWKCWFLAKCMDSFVFQLFQTQPYTGSCWNSDLEVN